MAELENDNSVIHTKGSFTHNSEHTIREQELLQMLRKSVAEINEYFAKIDNVTLIGKVDTLFSTEEFQL